MEETSLDDFAASDGAADPETADRDDEPGDAGATSDASEAAAGRTRGSVERPAQPRVTAAWSADAEPCVACGEPAPWRWAQDGAMVCPRCKDW
jgi:hypothetical protein